MLNRIPFRPHPDAVSIGLVCVATLLTQQLEIMLTESQTLLFLAAVGVSSWYGGLKSGGLAAILSVLSIKFFFVPPVHALAIANLDDGIRLISFALVALTGSLPATRLKQVKQPVQDWSDRNAEESEAQLRLVLQAARMGTWQLDLTTEKTIWTAETEQLFGFTPGSFDGEYETFLDCIHPDDREALNRATQTAIQSGNNYRHDYRIIWPDGSVHWIEGNGQVFYDAQGQPARMIGSAIDITDRKRTEEILRQYERVVSATPDKVSLVDRSYTYRLVNQTYLSASQKQREEIIGHTVSELLGETVFQTRVKPQFDRCLAGETIRYESWFDYPDGEAHFLSVTYAPYVELDGTISGVVVTARDLNDLKQAETALEESRAFLNQIINVISDMIFVKDEQHRFVLVNQACCNMTGIAQEVFLGRSDYHLFPKEQADYFRTKDEHVFQTGLEDVAEELLTNPNGETHWLLTKKACFQNQHGQKFLVGASRDITKRKRTEQILQDSEERFRLLIHNIDVGIVLAGAQAEILACNQMALELLGLTEVELLSRTIRDAMGNAMHEDGSVFDPATLPISQAIATQQPVQNVVVGVHPVNSSPVNSSNLIWLLVSAVPQFDTEGNVCFVICSFNDISARKQAEAILQRQANQEQAFNRVVQAIRHSLDQNVIFSAATREFAELLQLDLVGIPQYFPEQSCWIPIVEHLRNPGSLSLLGVEITDNNNPITEQLKRREIVLVENTHTLNDPVNQAIAQQHTPVAWLMVPLEVNGMIWGCLVGVKSPLPATFTKHEIHLAQRFADQVSIAIQQANLYRQVQQLNQELEQRVQERTAALQESEEKFRQLAENINHVFWMEDTAGQTLYTSPSYEEIWGQPIETLYHNPNAWLDTVYPDDRDHVIAQQSVSQKCFVREIEYRITRSDGAIRWIRDRSFPIRNDRGDVYRIAGLAEDITERKQAEVDICRSRELFAAMFEESADAIFLVDYTTRSTLTCNHRAVELFEADSRNELIGIYGSQVLHKHPFTPEESKTVRMALEKQGTWQGEIEYRTRKGNTFWGSIACKQIQVGNEPMFLVRVTDVSDRHRMEAALRQSEARFQHLAANIPGIFYQSLIRADGSRQFHYVSSGFKNLFELEPAQLIADPTLFWTMMHPDDVEPLRAEVARTLLSQEPFQFEYRIISPSGRVKWIHNAASRQYLENGDIVSDGVVLDITDRKQAELERQRQAEADQLLAVIAQTINQSVYLNEVLDVCLEQIRQFLQCDRVIVARFEADHRLVIEMEAVSRSDLSLLGYTFPNPGLGSDWFESIRQGEVIVNNDVQAEVLPLSYADFLSQAQARARVLVPILQADQFWGLLIVNQCDQPRHWQSLEIDLLKQLGLQVGTAGQKASLYTQLESQLTQKEILLKEVHHRVKNNLQVISSMLWLQTKATNQSTLSEVLSDTRSRLQAMALIHETLYRSSNLGQLNFHDYIRCLANGILSAHSSSPNQISLSYQLQPVTFNLDTAIPCGLLLNELITNAIKHAFPHQKSGEIRITLEKLLREPSSPGQSLPGQSSPGQSLMPVQPLASSCSLPSVFSSPNGIETEKQRSSAIPCYVLTIQDNGVGIPADLDLKKLKSLGLKIAYDLALQLRGSLELDRTHGTQFRLIFSALPYRNRV